MAEVVNIGGREYKKRGPIAVWLLALVTIGVYYLVWYYKINKEARDYLGDQTIQPVISLLAVLFGWILLFIPPLVSTFNTGKRIRRMQERAGISDTISPGIGLLLFLVARLDMPYLQEHLNRIWNRYLGQPAVAGLPGGEPSGSAAPSQTPASTPPTSLPSSSTPPASQAGPGEFTP